MKGKTVRLERTGDRAVLQTTYRCPPEHCLACIRREACTPSPKLGRSVSRLEHEDLVDELRRMETAEAKTLYKLRRQTIELRYADLKEHRHLRRFHHYGTRRERAELAQLLAYNPEILWETCKTARPRRNLRKSPRKSHPERRTDSKAAIHQFGHVGLLHAKCFRCFDV